MIVLSAGSFGADDVFAVETLAQTWSRFSGEVADAFGLWDGFEAVAFFGDVEDAAALAPGGRDFGSELGLFGEERS